MPQPDRHDLLVSHLEHSGRASVAQLARDLGVTPATIRRDLQQLADEGRLLRTYGGATVADRRLVRDGRAIDAKRAIARAAEHLVVDGTTIAISSGTTALEFARRLVDRRLTVITNALDVANVLVDRAGIELIVVGGAVRPRMHSMLGHLSGLAASELRADTLFFGIGAISLEQGLMNDYVPEIQTDRALRAMARRLVVLADATKFDLVAPAYVFGLEDVDVVVTDSSVAEDTVAEMEGRGYPGHRRVPRGCLMSDSIILDEVRQGPAAIRATLHEAAAAAQDAAAMLRKAGTRRIYLVGNGTSRHSALAAASLYAHHAGPDDPVVIPMTAGEFRTYRPALGPRDALVGISSSGEFTDVVGSFEEVRDSLPTIAVVHVPGSTLTRIADAVVISSGGPSNVPVMTKTFSATLVATEMTLLALLGQDCAGPVLDAIAAAADHAERVIAAAEDWQAGVAATLEGFDHLFVVGAGLAHPAALEAALKLKEVARVHAEGTETWEASSGAATMLDERSVVIALAPNGPGQAATAELVRHAAGWGALTVEIAPAPADAGSLLLRLPPEAQEDHAPLTTVPPLVLVAVALARGRGSTPTGRTGSPATTARGCATSWAWENPHDPDRPRRRRQRRVHPQPARRLPVLPGARGTRRSSSTTSMRTASRRPSGWPAGPPTRWAPAPPSRRTSTAARRLPAPTS